MVSPQAVKKLTQLGVFPKTVSVNADVFEHCSSLEEISKEAIKFGWSCSPGQFIYFHLGELLKDKHYNSQFIKEAEQVLGGLGISSRHIDEYYHLGADPELVFSLRHGVYTSTIRKTFYDRANQFTLDKMREWLGFK